ncbi:MAG: glycosyltransferase family 4 protein, partial [Bacteriovoracaceae bacterium]|nr:glycosyltransferase family 4 protein [Bacteriovoracaceae bacterium]
VYEPLNSNNNFMTIHNGFDEKVNLKRIGNTTRDENRKSLNIEEHEIYILIVGTVCDRKGQKDLIQALDILDDELFNHIKIGIVGDRPSIPYSQELHQLVERLPEPKRNTVKIFPETKDVSRFYQSADIFVCSSRIESFPKVIQEAMYFENAIITTPVFGIVEQVKDEVSSLYYSPGDYEQLANQITRLVADESLRKTIASNGKIALGILPTFEEVTKMYEDVFVEAWWSGESR